MNFKETFLINIRNLPGWFSKRKIVVIESDDWGSIRMPSREAYHRLTELGIDLRSIDYERYNLFDTLEGSEDLENLYDVLTRVKDRNGKHCVITAVSVVANPDFRKIKQENFQNYYYEPFTSTLERYSGRSQTFNVLKEGIKNNIFIPEFHGREHLNVAAWMCLLKMNHEKTHKAFDEEMWGFVPDQTPGPVIENQAAFHISDPSELNYHAEILSSGLDLFEEIYGYRASYFVPPNGPFNNSLNKLLAEKGIRFRSTAKIQNESIGHGRYRKVIHWLGQNDPSGITYITRNCFFEPCGHPEIDWVDSCLNDISAAFRWKKPAIISSHRVNYMGGLYHENRDNNLKKLAVLLENVIKRWPDVEFMTTTALGKLIAGDSE